MFEPRVAVASLSGESDAAWAGSAEPYVGCAFLGGVALDDETRSAARRLVERDRTEFLPDSPLSFLDRQLSHLDDADLRAAVNVRSVDPERTREAAAICLDHGAILEINAHCRQAEMCSAGAGETLLRDGDSLREHVDAASSTGAAVSVKLRTEVDGVDLPQLASLLVDAGADALHVDAMDSELVVAEVVSAAPNAFVIANNCVRDRETAHEYLDYGADAVSVGRPSDDPVVLARVCRAVEAWFDDGLTDVVATDSELIPDA